VTDRPYRVEFAGAARRGIDRLPAKAASAAVEFCFGPLAANPRRVGKPLTGELAGRHVARRGEYRVIYGVDDNVRVVRTRQ
jgi:mRNA-degrading endonuclease RelE of RelBE toxin-antitoxin system